MKRYILIIAFLFCQKYAKANNINLKPNISGRNGEGIEKPSLQELIANCFGYPNYTPPPVIIQAFTTTTTEESQVELLRLRNGRIQNAPKNKKRKNRKKSKRKKPDSTRFL